MKFSDLGLGDDVLRAVDELGYETPTPIQAQAIPFVLMGRDVLGCAQTGTGKTAGFTLPMIEILAAGRSKSRMPRSLILEPTRELAAQVAEAFDRYGRFHRLTKALLIGGESMADQVKILERGVDVLIATPGRLLDVFERGHLLLNDVRVLVIDEADRMLDMGFIPDVERIVSLVSRMRQTLFFSATMPPEIRRLADAFLSNPKEISVAPPATPAETVEQGLVIVAGAGREPGGQLKAKRAALRALIGSREVGNALVFCNRKRDVGVVQRSLKRHGYGAEMLHGDMAQSARSDVLARFRAGAVPLLVCSDVAARGLDIAGIDHVFNFDVPTHAEDYVHRIGRTGRAGREGAALTIAVPEDGKYVTAIEQLIGREIPRIEVDGITAGDLEQPARRGRRRRGRGNDRESAPPADKRRQQRPDNVAAASNSQRPDNVAAGPVRQEPETRGRRPRPATAVKPVAKEPAKEPRRRSRRDREDDQPVVGMGDHVPAFLLREVKV